ncbi:MAG TPA: hypothetical protein VJ762_13670 [Sphingobium sp.]|nr:hypothetical protein [Sphingobium sp.]
MYDRELKQAQEKIVEAGRSPDDFQFDMAYQEPEPDGGGMFTVMYDVTVTYLPTGKRFGATGGIGFRWVDEFAYALDTGHFDG